MTGIVWWDGNSMSTMPVHLAARNLLVLYEDNHLLVVSKPARLATMGVAPDRPSLLGLAKQYIRQRYHKPGNVYLGIVSRLDAPVTGVVLLARLMSRFVRHWRTASPA